MRGGRGAPARYPPNGSWPGVMRADMAAAFFDLDSVAALHAALARGEVPRPTDMRGSGRTREPLWSTDACRNFLARRNDVAGADSESLASLV